MKKLILLIAITLFALTTITTTAQQQSQFTEIKQTAIPGEYLKGKTIVAWYWPTYIDGVRIKTLEEETYWEVKFDDAYLVIHWTGEDGGIYLYGVVVGREKEAEKQRITRVQVQSIDPKYPRYEDIRKKVKKEFPNMDVLF